MIVPDVNLLLYAVDAGSPQHGRARSWLEETLSGTETVAFGWSVVLAFVRLVTNPRVYSAPLDARNAIGIVSGWLGQPNAITVDPTGRHLALLDDLLKPFGTAGNLTMDAHLAALAIEHGAELHSADSDFSRFAGLSWSNPLAD
jgi:toxin-antitoxin system PIN domain toxin